MSVQSQIERISAAVADSYTAAADIGATIPQTQTVDNLPETIRSIPTGGIKLQSIAVTTPPTKTSYLSGERFDPTGMVVTATYSNGAKLAATGYAVEPSGPLSDGMTSVTIRYTEGGRSVTTTQAVTVIPKLVSIAVTTPPTKTAYRYGEAFSAAGMVVTATYTDGNSAAVTGYTTSPASFTSIGDQSVTVKYTENGVSVAVTTPVTVSRAVISTVPSQSGSLTYTGSALSPSWNNYNSAQLTIGGTTSATNAGTYTATFTPISNYEWSDGTTAAKSVSWTIGKAAGSLSITPTSLTLNTSNPTGKITVTRAGNGTISAESSDTSVATVSVSGTTVTVTGKASGSTTITISVGAGTNHTAPSNKTCAITVIFLVNTFANNSWEDIIAACQSGIVPDSWVVGNSKTMTINGRSYQIEIIGKNHDNYADGSGKAPLTFQLQDCYDEAKQMNSTDTNRGGWESSAMRNTHLPAILALMPSEVQAGIKEVNKLTSAGGQSNTIITTADKLFLLSEVEISGIVDYSKSGEGSQYAYYSAGNSTMKKLNGGYYYWWERSPNGKNSTSFCCVGNMDVGTASNAIGVAFAFCF